MSSSGGQFSVNKFFNTLKSLSIKYTKNSLHEYLDHLIDAFLFYTVPIHSRSEKSRLINSVKIYPIDAGLLNAMTFVIHIIAVSYSKQWCLCNCVGGIMIRDMSIRKTGMKLISLHGTEFPARRS